MDRGAWQATVHGVTKSQLFEQLCKNTWGKPRSRPVVTTLVSIFQHDLYFLQNQKDTWNYPPLAIICVLMCVLSSVWQIFGAKGRFLCKEIACMSAKSLQSCLTHVTLWTIAHQAPPSMGFSRQKYWSGLSCPPPGDLPNPGMEPLSFVSPAGRVLYH